MHAVHDHLAPAGQVCPPPLHVIRGRMERRYDEFPSLREIAGASNVHNDWRRGGAKPSMKIAWRDRWKNLLHDNSPRLSRPPETSFSAENSASTTPSFQKNLSQSVIVLLAHHERAVRCEHHVDGSVVWPLAPGHPADRPSHRPQPWWFQGRRHMAR